MKRRQFLASSLAASAVTGAASSASRGASGPKGTGPEYYELRRYLLRRGPQQKRVDDYLREAFLPAAKRAGVGPVGVFQVSIGPEIPSMYALIAYRTAESMATLMLRLANDPEYQRAGAPLIDCPATDPAYIRTESSFMVAFESIPKLEIPPAAAGNQPRIFELRTYENHSKKANRTKIRMFNTGEIAIFRRTGLRPVFFGETLIGPRLPNLTYMLTFASLEERQKNWGAFISDPEWKKLSTTRGYTDPEIVSNITNLILSPAPYSEI